MRNAERKSFSSDNEPSKGPALSSPAIARRLLDLQRQLIVSVHEQNAMLIQQQQQLIDILATPMSQALPDDEAPTKFLDGSSIR